MSGNKASSDVTSQEQRHLVRLLKLLTRKSRSGVPAEISGAHAVFQLAERRYTIPASVPVLAVSCRYARWSGDRLLITQEGRIALDQFLRLGSCAGQSGRDKQAVPRPAPGLNPVESPLARLRSRKTGGKPYITSDQFEAGERLRADFEKGQLQPRITATLGFRLAGRGTGSAANHALEISDLAMEARNRVNRAAAFLGPELAGVALDICCFLKGLEQVERERRWPPRSAKLMLRTALSRLSRHYGLCPDGVGKGGDIVAWGDADYRPNLYPAGR